MGARCFTPHPTLGHLGFGASIEDRFWSKVLIVPYDRGCWEWLGFRREWGHGSISIGRGPKKIGAHVLSWILHNGPIPEGLSVLHRCDNGWCVNPSHLWIGTQLDNIRDCISKSRNALGEKQGIARLTDELVRKIRLEWPQLNQCALANKYGLNHGTIWKVVHRKTWRHVE